MTIYVTMPPDKLPINHCKFGKLIVQNNKVTSYSFDDTININEDIFFNKLTHFWNYAFKDGVTLEQLEKEEDIIIFTKDSHPEYFI